MVVFMRDAVRLLSAGVRRTLLSQVREFLQRYSQLPDDFEKERRANLAAIVDGNGDCAPVRVIPSFVATGLAG